MPQSFSRKPLLFVLRMLCLAATLSLGLAHADEYADVSRLMRSGQFADALTKADQYLASKPRDPQMRFFKGVIQTETGKVSDAIATFTKITEDYPELPEPYNNIAVLYAGQSQFDKARTALEMAIKTNPSYSTAHENLGDVYARLASQAYSKALQLDSGNPGIQPKLSLIRTLFTPDIKVQAQTQTKPTPETVAPTAVSVIGSKPNATPPTLVTTPVAKPAATVATVNTQPHANNAAGGNAEKEVEAAVTAWAQAWSSKDVKAYLASYGENFDPPGKRDRKTWEEDRRARIVGKSRISVKVTDLAISAQGNKASAKFKQHYSANGLDVSSRKTLQLVKVNDRWLIVKESSGN